HFVQFIYREELLRGNHLSGTACTSVSKYPLATDAAKPVWNPDALAKPSPYYDAWHSGRADCASLTIFDEPSFHPAPCIPNDPGICQPGTTCSATVVDYAMCGGKVVGKVTWVTMQPPTPAGATPLRSYSVTIEPASDIPQEFKDLLTSKGYRLP